MRITVAEGLNQVTSRGTERSNIVRDDRNREKCKVSKVKKVMEMDSRMRKKINKCARTYENFKL